MHQKPMDWFNRFLLICSDNDSDTNSDRLSQTGTNDNYLKNGITILAQPHRSLFDTCFSEPVGSFPIHQRVNHHWSTTVGVGRDTAMVARATIGQGLVGYDCEMLLLDTIIYWILFLDIIASDPPLLTIP